MNSGATRGRGAVSIARALLVWALIALSLNAMAAATLPLAVDLHDEAAQAARAKVPLIVLFSLPGCPHCEVVRRSHLLPLLAEKPPRARVVQIDLKSPSPLTDFSGRKTTHGEYSQQQKIVLAPVVMFLGRDGQPLAAPLVGSMIPDFYGAYFDDALSEAQNKLTPALQSRKP